MGEKLIGYKVVRKYEGKYIPCFSPANYEYKIGKTTKRKKNDGALCVFSRLEYAQYFIRDAELQYWNIFRCEYTEFDQDIRKMGVVLPTWGYPMFYRKKEGCVVIAGIVMLPYGTKFAESVKLLEEVK